MAIINPAAYIATNPEDLPRDTLRAIGPENHKTLQVIAAEVPEIICAWGAVKVDPDAVALALGIFRENFCRLLCWGTTKDGHPRHPLYLRADTPLVPFEPCLT